MAQNGVVEEHLRQFQNWGTWGSEAVKFGMLLAPHLKDTTPDISRSIIQHYEYN